MKNGCDKPLEHSNEGKTARKLEKSFKEEKTWLLGVYARLLVQSVTVAYGRQGCLSLNPSCEPGEVPAWFHSIKYASPTNQADY